MAAHIEITQAHTLGKMEAKRRCEAKANELCAKWGLSQSWVDNVCTASGLGVKAVVTVRVKNVDCVIDLPDSFDSQAGVIEDKARHTLSVTLA